MPECSRGIAREHSHEQGHQIVLPRLELGQEVPLVSLYLESSGALQHLLVQPPFVCFCVVPSLRCLQLEGAYILCR